MYQLHISQTTFVQSSKYLIIIRTTQQTKRSEICSLWTSSPTFDQPIIVNSLTGLLVRACTSTMDKKLAIIGEFRIQATELDMDNLVIFQSNRNFNQKIQGKQVTVGTCKLKIIKKHEQAHLQTQPSTQQQLHQITSQYQLKSQSDQQNTQQQQTQQPLKCQLKFIIHGGFDFYLNSAFRVCIKWGSHKLQTKLIENRMIPWWGQVFNMEGKDKKQVEITVEDGKNSILEWLKLDPKQLRIMYPYHLHIHFREQYIGMYPHFYITIIRQDVPLFSILDRKININIGYIGSYIPQQAHQYILIYPKTLQTNQVNKLPIFIQLQMKNFISFTRVNKIIQQNIQKKYQWTNWNLLIPITTYDKYMNVHRISLLKSSINKSLVCLYFSLSDQKSLFCNQTWNSVTILERRQSFENNIKQLYYQEKKIVMGKTVEFTNSDIESLQSLLQPNKKPMTLQQKWKILTQNYLLRKNLLTNSITITQTTKTSIKQKGEYLQQLKKILLEVMKINTVMTQKEKSALMEQNDAKKKVQENYDVFSIDEVIKLLFEKQIELEKRKKINDEMRMRMDSLHYFNQDSQQLNNIIVDNAQNLLQQQSKIKQMNKMRQTLPKQRQVILKLQKLFEKRQIDRQMNELLQKQQNKLSQMKKINNQNLEYVYNIVKQHRNGPYSLLQNIKAAENQLINLNAYYAKLTTM